MNAQTTFTLAEAIARLHPSYELVYVDYRDELSDTQVAALVRGDYETLDESLDEWTSDSAWEGTESVITETFTTDEWESLSSDDQKMLREAIMGRDTSDALAELIRHTSNPLLRVCVVDEDDAWSFEPVEASDVLAKVGLDATEHNVRVVDYALANASPEFSVLFGYWIITIDLATLYAAAPDDMIRITNPHLYLGNPFAGSGFITEEPLHGTIVVPRAELRTDKDAFGYSVNEVYGGLTASTFDVDAEIVEVQS